MKTIEEAAKAANSYGYPNYTGATNESFNSGFKAGVEFAQRWIPVDKLEEDGIYICKDDVANEFYICWYINGKFKLTIRTPHKSHGVSLEPFPVSYCDGNMFREDVTEFITHYRPIEYK